MINIIGLAVAILISTQASAHRHTLAYIMSASQNITKIFLKSIFVNITKLFTLVLVAKALITGLVVVQHPIALYFVDKFIHLTTVMIHGIAAKEKMQTTCIVKTYYVVNLWNPL